MPCLCVLLAYACNLEEVEKLTVTAQVPLAELWRDPRTLPSHIQYIQVYKEQ